MAQSIYRPKTETWTFPLAKRLRRLSHELDIIEGQPPRHSVRCAWIGAKVRMATGLSGGALSDLYFSHPLPELQKEIGFDSRLSFSEFQKENFERRRTSCYVVRTFVASVLFLLIQSVSSDD